MSVKLRLRRMGKKKQPFYRIVAIDSRRRRDGRYIENLGTYNPLKEPPEVVLKEDRALYWLQKGAIPSDTVRSFLKRKGILLKWHLMKQGVEESAIEEELKRWEVLQLERQKRLEALAAHAKREAKTKVKEEPTGAEEAAVETAEVAEDTTPAEAKAEEVEAGNEPEAELASEAEAEVKTDTAVEGEEKKAEATTEAEAATEQEVQAPSEDAEKKSD